MSKSSPLVSICVPSYNSSSYLRASLNSLLSQTYKNIEVVFVDDASTDDSWNVALDFEPLLTRKLAKVVMLKNERNLGTLMSMHNAFQHMTGDFISYLDADDYLLPTKVEKNVRFLLENPGFGGVHSDFVAVDERYNVTHDFWKQASWFTDMPYGWIFERLLTINPICAATLLVRKDLWDRCYTFDVFAERKYGMGDYPGHINLSYISQIGYINESLAHYRQRDNSMSHSVNQHKRDQILRNIARVQQDARIGVLRPLPESAVNVNTRAAQMESQEFDAFTGRGLSVISVAVQ